ncbi:MAG: hypothetical protein ACOCUT_00995 [bacterium]
MIEKQQEQKRYDLFLSGPWEQYSEVPWKSELKKAFPTKQLYDPEDHQNGDWFVTNGQAIERSSSMVVYVPEFPFSGAGLEAGIFYERIRSSWGAKPSPNLIYLWRDSVQPDWGKEVAKRTGIVVPTLEETIKALQKVM